MRKIFILMLFVGAVEMVWGQVPQWQWAKNIGSSGSDDAYDVATDINGNVYITGAFAGDEMYFADSTYISRGSFDFFVAKYDSLGNELWAKSAGGNLSDWGNSLTTDLDGNVIITGSYRSDTIVWGNDTLIKESGNSSNFFVVKYDQHGNLLWLKSGGNLDEDNGYGIAVNSNDNIIVTGAFGDSIAFDNIVLYTDSGNAVFIVMYNSSGNVIWAKKEDGAAYEYGEDVTIDSEDNILVVGSSTSPSIAFGNNVVHNSGLGWEFFVVKYDSLGNCLWAKGAQSGQWDDQIVGSISADAIGNSYVTGVFQDSITFQNHLLVTSGFEGVFIVKYNEFGDVLWARQSLNTGSVWQTDNVCDLNGNLYLTGYFRGNEITFGDTTIDNPGFENIFLTAYQSDGTVLWVEVIGCPIANNNGNGLATDIFGSIYITGHFGCSVLDFGNNTILASEGEIFTAKIKTVIIDGISEFNSVGFTLFPNPATTQLTITGYTPAYLTLCNTLGQTVAEATNTTTLLLGSLPQGLYVLQLFDAKGGLVKTEKVVKE